MKCQVNVALRLEYEVTIHHRNELKAKYEAEMQSDVLRSHI